jgi:leucyl aminopeptidase
MLRVDILNQDVWELGLEGNIFFVSEGCKISGAMERVEKEFYPNICEVLSRHKFSGKLGETFTLTAPVNGQLAQFVFIGIGSMEHTPHENMERLRRAIGSSVKELRRLEIKRAALEFESLDASKYGLEKDELLKQLVTTFNMSGYSFDKFKSKKNGSSWTGSLSISVKNMDDSLSSKALFEGRIIGEACNFTRHISDMPPNIATPEYVSEQAKQLAEKFGFKCLSFGRDRAEELGMGGFLAVDEGSDKEGKFLEMTYSCGKPDAKTIALVGKGVTFDSGGISLKPANYMKGMKYDMSGAAAVIGAMQAIAQLKPNVNVVGLTPLVENMPSGKSVRQDDVITHLNGVTTEVENTDAEGRLILADALAYAEKFHKPDVIIDIATLTGACVVALGHFFTGMMTKDEKLGGQLVKVGQKTGDWVWPLPLHEFYAPAIKSEIADITNTGNSKYGAGTIKAGHFLSNFVAKTPWAHLDIAGTEMDVPDAPHLGRGATGVGVRFFVEFVSGFEENNSRD